MQKIQWVKVVSILKLNIKPKMGILRAYYPDFFVKTDANTFYILETKGREDLDDVRKIKRLAIWCKDINTAQKDYTYTPVYVKQEEWEKKTKDIKLFKDVVLLFGVKETEQKLTREEALAIIKKGADMSSFGDPVEWQREVRKDRRID